MKKNKMMRIASVLLVAVLISTCAISGTFAKYVTRAEGTDTARVAKWGILLTIDGGNVFADKYLADDAAYKAAFDDASEAYSVVSSTVEKVVAPGTGINAEDKNALIATVKGTPEVATRCALRIGKDFTDVVLPAGIEYPDYTQLVYDADNDTYGYTKTIPALDKAYTPVKWDIAVSKGNKTVRLTDYAKDYPDILNNEGYSEKGFSFTDIVEILTGQHQDALLNLLTSVVSNARNPQVKETDNYYEISLDFDPNKEMDFTFELTWAWDFEQITAEEGEELTDDEEAVLAIFDALDTYLGNVAAGVVDEVPEGVSTKIYASLTATATQID